MQGISTVEELFNYKNDQFDRQSPTNHRRYFQIAGITVCLESDLDLNTIKFLDSLTSFAVEGPGKDNVSLRHHFTMPDLNNIDLGKEFYKKPPWAISNKDGIWCYKGIMPDLSENRLHQLAFFTADHKRGVIYNNLANKKYVLSKCWGSLSLMPTDQIWLGPLLADRCAVMLHSAAAIINGGGFIFVGHSDAGKTTTIDLLLKARREKGLDTEILCDDRNIIRRLPHGYYLHGTWSHGDIADVSPAAAPLKGIFFLEQTEANEIIYLTDRKLIFKSLLATIIRPMVTVKWWDQILDTIEQIINEVPCFTMRFNKSGGIVSELSRLDL